MLAKQMPDLYMLFSKERVGMTSQKELKKQVVFILKSGLKIQPMYVNYKSQNVFNFDFQGDSDSRFQILIEFLLLHLAVIENKPETFLAILKYFK